MRSTAFRCVDALAVGFVFEYADVPPASIVALEDNGAGVGFEPGFFGHVTMRLPHFGVGASASPPRSPEALLLPAFHILLISQVAAKREVYEACVNKSAGHRAGEA